MDAGLLPVKRLDAAKGRLQGYFDAKQRVELAAAMLEDALDLCGAADFLEWYVVSADSLVLERAVARGFGAIADPDEGGLNESLRHAISTLPPDADSVTVIPVDAPLTSLDELRDLVDTGALSDVVVVPADRDAGTNGLYLSPPDLMHPRFGENSFSAYVREAEATKHRCSILPLDGLAIDIDTVEDVERVAAEAEPASRTVKLLKAWVAEKG